MGGAARDRRWPATRTDAEFLLLTDADIAHEPDSLRESGRRRARPRGLDLVSQMARLRVESAWERLVVPAFVYFFAQLYPFRWVNRPAAADGGRGRRLCAAAHGGGRAGAASGRASGRR